MKDIELVPGHHIDLLLEQCYRLEVAAHIYHITAPGKSRPVGDLAGLYLLVVLYQLGKSLQAIKYSLRRIGRQVYFPGAYL
jgi:hypothetical protein